MRKKLEFFFYLTELEEKVWGSHYIYICARWEIIDGIVFMGSGISIGDALLWLIDDMGTLRNNKEGLYMWAFGVHLPAAMDKN